MNTCVYFLQLHICRRSKVGWVCSPFEEIAGLGEIDRDAPVIVVEAMNAAAEGSKRSLVQPRRHSTIGLRPLLLQA